MEVIVEQPRLMEDPVYARDCASARESDGLVSPELSPLKAALAYSSGIAYVMFAVVMWFFLPLLDRGGNKLRK